MDREAILKIRELLIVSLQSDLTDLSVMRLQEDILNKIYLTKARGVLIDISVLDMVDSFLGRVISDTAKMIQLMGAKTVLVGMKPGVAITLIELGLEIGSVETALDIEAGMELFSKKAHVHGLEGYFFPPGEEKDDHG